jgi:hypothetical protein
MNFKPRKKSLPPAMQSFIIKGEIKQTHTILLSNCRSVHTVIVFLKPLTLRVVFMYQEVAGTVSISNQR